MVGLKLPQTPLRLYAYLLRKTRLLPAGAQPYYRNYIKQVGFASNFHLIHV